MSTRSSIAVKQNDGKVKAIYCHSDGYPGHVGEMLLNHHNSKEQADQIIELGNLSFLDKYLEPQQELHECRYDYRISGKVKHSFETPHKDVTTAYMRDRGETGQEAATYNSEEEWMADWNNYGAAYMYIFKDGKWHVEGVELTEKIINGDEGLESSPLRNQKNAAVTDNQKRRADFAI